MTVIDCLFYAFNRICSYVSLKHIATWVVSWLFSNCVSVGIRAFIIKFGKDVFW